MEANSFRRCYRLLVVLVVGVALVLTACSAPSDDGSQATESADQTGPAGDEAWQKVVEAAKSEGTVTIYSALAQSNLEELASRFESTYGIKVTIARDVDANVQTKLNAERQTNQNVADVVMQTDSVFANARGAEGWYVAPGGPAFRNPDYDKPANFSSGGNLFLALADVVGFGWNTDLYSKGITNYNDFLDPALANGKIGITPITSTSVVDWWSWVEQKTSPEFMEKLAAQKPRIYPSILPIAQAIASGEIAASPYVLSLDDEKSDGAPVDSGIEPPAWGGRYWTAVYATAPHPNAAQLLANFMVTPAGQEAIARQKASVLPNITGAITTTEQVAPQELSGITPDDVVAERATFDRLFSQ